MTTIYKQHLAVPQPLSIFLQNSMNSTLDSTAVAEYLAENPKFFQEHTELLAQVQLTSPLTGRAVSLQERQMEVMRGKYKALEFRLSDLIRTAQENDVISGKFHAWTLSLLQARNDADLPRTLTSGLRMIFSVPHASLRLWRVAAEYSDAWFTHGVTEDARIFANSLTAPYCGTNHDFEAVRWLEDAPEVESVVILPLRVDSTLNLPEAFGLLILGSADAQRFTADMATDFLINIGETAGAALACLLD